MFGINELLSKAFSKQELSVNERFDILNSKKIDPEVVEYLMKKFENLNIEVLGDYKGSLFDLMPLGNLLGWCWQTTESAIVFLNDDDYIERGDLYFDKETPKYFHSWICFNYNNVEYVLDPCLDFLCKKDDYVKIFEVNVKGSVSAKDVRDELIRQISKPKIESNKTKERASFEKFFRSMIGEKYEQYRNNQKNEVIVHGPEDINTPLYRNGAGYRAELKNGKIKKLTVHYYYIDC